VTLHLAQVPRRSVGRVIDALAAWSPPGCYAAGLHPGDVGWQLKTDDPELEESLVLVTDDSEEVAVALFDAPDAVRVAVRPDRVHDLAVAASIADLAEARVPAARPCWVDVTPETALRSTLSARGWVLGSEPWAALYKALGEGDGRPADSWSRPLDTEDDIAGRVAVQRSAFQRSTFTVERWHQMAAGPGYDSSLDLLRRTPDGAPAAAATGWSAGPGRCGILEPVGTHPDHAGHGHGRAVSLAVIAALARRGASGVTVHTPLSNAVAVRAYESCGMRVVEHTRALMRPPSA
jgi:ribosomal protein S18 acetylase RimI-like enzyme